MSEALLGEPSPETSSTCGGWSTAFLGPRGLCDIVLHLSLHCQALPASHCCVTGLLQARLYLTNFFSALQWVSRCPSGCLLRRKARAWGWWGAWKEASVTLHPRPNTRKLCLKGSSSEAWEKSYLEYGLWSDEKGKGKWLARSKSMSFQSIIHHD